MWTIHTVVDTAVLCSTSCYRKCSKVPVTCTISLLCRYITCGIMAEQCAYWKRPSSGYSRRGLLLYVRGIVVHARCRCAYVFCHLCTYTLMSPYLSGANEISSPALERRCPCGASMRGCGSPLCLLFRLSLRLRRFRVRACGGRTCSAGESPLT